MSKWLDSHVPDLLYFVLFILLNLKGSHIFGFWMWNRSWNRKS